MPLIPLRPCGLRGLLLASVVLPALTGQPPRLTHVDAASVIQLTYENNLRVAAARHDVAAAEFQFQRFERNLSQFQPFILESRLDRELEREWQNGTRGESREDDASVAVGVAKEFFGGTRLESKAGVRRTREDRTRHENPFVELDMRFPLLGSFTRLERITERSFEESEMLGSWLDFIETVRDAIADSQLAYFELQHRLSIQALLHETHADFITLLNEEAIRSDGPAGDLLRDQIQAFQSRLVEQDGRITAAQISLIDRLGLDGLPLSAVGPLHWNRQAFYGANYLGVTAPDLIAQALASDVSLRVIQIARENARLKRELAERGKWDITGRLSGGYDFDGRETGTTGREGYRAGLAISVERNDPQLLSLSLKLAAAEERKYEARIAYRRRQLTNEITRRLGRTTNLVGVIGQLEESRTLRRRVFQDKRAAFLRDDESLDNVILSRIQLFETENDFLESLATLYEMVVDLNAVSGAYYSQLEGMIERLENVGSRDAARGARSGGVSAP